ncbi:MAG: hypothetical protein PHE68_05305 [Candidatus Peribacteraceae bacterium]|nr:hypothetical protein [Candidatus Peribacteraceae bacterium]MDD5074539.1 hypothetical protein [Candidatus Peribacteraceae bacterium]
MSILSLLRRSTLGIQVTDDVLRAGMAEIVGEKVNLTMSAKVDLPAGIVERGTVRDIAKLQASLKQLLGSLSGSHPSRVTLCVPADIVYSCRLFVPFARISERDRILKSVVAQTVPEPVEDLVIAFTVLGSVGTDQNVVVVCMRRDVLQAYAGALKAAGLHLCAIVTVPAIVSGLDPVGGDHLVVAINDAGAATITAFLGGWPAEEAVLRAPAESAVAGEAQSMLADMASGGTRLTRVIVAGDGKEEIANACTQPGLRVESFSVLSPQKTEWLGVIGGLAKTPWSGAVLSAAHLSKWTRLRILAVTGIALLFADLLLLWLK